MSPATGAVPYVVNRLYWLACSSLSGGTRFGTEASLAGVQNSEAQDGQELHHVHPGQLVGEAERQVERDGQVQHRRGRTSPMIMFSRRSIRSATAPASGPSISAGSSEDSQTPPTAAALRGEPAARPGSSASVDSATRLSQSPRLDSDVAIHSRRNGLMDSTPSRRVCRRGSEVHCVRVSDRDARAAAGECQLAKCSGGTRRCPRIEPVPAAVGPRGS